MPDIKITVWKAVKAGILFVVGGLVAYAVSQPWAALPIGSVLVGIENYARIWLEGK